MAAPSTTARTASGKLDANGQVQLDWGKAVNIRLAKTHAAITGFALEPQRKSRGTPIAWSKLETTIDQIDTATRQATLASVVGTGLQLDVRRSANNRIDLLDLFATRNAASPKPATDSEPAWHWSIGHLGIENGSVRFTDFTTGNTPTRLDVQSLKGSVEGLSDKLDQAREMKLEGRLGKGRFAVAGKIRPQPVVADLDLTTQRLDIAHLAPYISVPLNVTISSARISGKGKLHYDGRRAEPRFAYRGRAALERVRVQDKVTGDDLMRWSSLTASHLNVGYGIGPPRVHVGGLVLSSFYARVIVNANGRLNLSDVVAKEEAAPVSVTRAENTAPAASRPATSTTSATPVAPATPAAPAADIRIGQIALVNGQLNYTDNFIKPNYTANLTRLTGKIGAFGTAAGGPPADLALQAELDDDSPVDISGTINPLAPVAFLDIKGKADQVELTRLSAYSSKYTGYPITQGKLSVDVQYLLDRGKLKADNHIFITQLTFGDRMESPGVSHLPVKLAVALLKDTQGNIDVNVPVSGSLDDPQFSMGRLIWHAIGNLIAKAVTSPFRLLSSAFGGSNHEDLGYIEFDPGSAVLDAHAQERLTQIVKMLGQKTSLTLDIIGRADPAKDEAGLRKITVDDMVRREKLVDETSRKQAADAPVEALAAVKTTPDEYDRFLRRAYRHADIDKPHNLIGLNKSLAPEEMRSLLETSVKTDPAAMRALAERRAAAVQAWLHGKLDDKRYAVKDPKLNAEGIDDKGKTTRTDFGLH